MSLEDNDRLFSYDIFFDELINVLINNGYITIEEDHSPENIMKILKRVLDVNKF